MSDKQSYPWKNERYLASYEEAESLKKALIASDRSATLQVKIKRCGLGGTRYVVKSRQDPNALAELEALEQKIFAKKNKSKNKVTNE